ncbi:MAG: DNA gyrase subunit A [Mycoplasmataceae bacterium]|nr:DNA gyrase subunit A [Mycoplasmataceae bacterium]
MEDNKLIQENIQDISISKEMETSFIDYAMSVIVSRAIPDARDGLKPVHRRILYAMYGLEMIHSKAFKKSSRAVGEVIAKFHPHGDTAVYDSMVRMAQPFSLRYPLVWGQGNFGSIDGDGAAAMRYTESKLKKISSWMLEDIKKDTVDFQENYDGSETEPKVLPGKIPNLLANGSTGIAVGMATSIPPHNLNEILDAAEALFKNKELESYDLLKYILAPDFPTGGILVNKNEIPQAYQTGRGRAIVRAKTNIVFDEIKNKGIIYITEIPYMVNKSNLILKIADLVKSKTINSIADIKDESNRHGIRVVIKLKKGFIPDVELNKLFKLTALQSNFPINILALVNNRPITLNLKTAIDSYNKHQIDILLRKTKFELLKAEARKHILQGLSIALENIDEVIELIKKSLDNQEAVSGLISKYNFSDIQAKSILEMKLNRLTGLERNNLLEEISKLDEMIKDHNLVINSKEEQIKRIITMFHTIKELFGDERRTVISDTSIVNINDEDLIPQEDVVITMSKKGYIKRLPVNEYRVQNRGGKGSRGATTSEEDYINDIIITNTHTDLLFFTSLGRVFRIRTHQIPQLGKNAKGLPIVNLIQIEKDIEEVRSIISMDKYKDVDLFFVTKKGIVKKTHACEFEKINRNGKKAITLKEGDKLIGVTPVSSIEDSEIILGNSNGKAIRFNSQDVRNMGRTASGVKGISIDKGQVVDYASSLEGNLILSISENGFGKLTDIQNYRLTNRGGKGVITINIDKAGELIGLTAVKGNEDLMIITNKGTIIRTELSQISKFSRNSKGVTIVKIKEDEKIASFSIVRPMQEIENEISEKTKEVIINIRKE